MLSVSNIPEHSNDVPDETQRIKLALGTVFSNSGAGASPLEASRDAADAYLTSFQPLTIAWMVCDILLREQQQEEDRDRSYESAKRYFAAQTLHSKCRYDIEQLPLESLPSLRESVLGVIFESSVSFYSNKPFVTRLSLAIAALSLHMNWTTVISDLIQHCSNHYQTPHSDANFILKTLELLSRIPEELNIRTKTDVDYYVAEIRKNTSLLFQFLDYCWDQAQSDQSNFSPKDRENILRQLCSCVDAHVYFLGIDQEVLNKTNTVAKMSQIMIMTSSTGQLYDSAADALITIIRTMNINLNHNVHATALNQVLQASVALARSFNPNTLDDEVTRMYVRIFSEMGETLCPALGMKSIENQDIKNGLNTLLEILLQCMDLETDVAVVALQFWFKFVNDTVGYDYELLDIYDIQLKQLLTKCVRLLKYPEDFGNLQEFLEDDDNFEGNRFAILDLLEDICRLTGPAYTAEILFECLTPDLITLEAVLMAFHGIDKFVPYDSREVFCLFQHIKDHVYSGTNNDFIVNTANLFTSSYARWLRMYQVEIPTVVTHLLKSVQNPVTQKSGCRSLDRIADDIAQLMDLSATMQVYSATELDPKNAVFLIECVAKQVAVNTDAKLVMEVLQYILNDNGCAFAVYCEKLTALVRFLPEALTVDVVKISWPTMASAAERDNSLDTNLAEKVCRFYKHAVRATKSLFEPLLDDLMKLFTSLFDQKLKSPYLYGASILVSEYPTSPNLSGMIQNLASKFLSTFKTLDQFIQAPDVVEEFFYLMGRTVQYAPDILSGQQQLLECTLGASMTALHLIQRDAYKAVLVFQESMLDSKLAQSGNSFPMLPGYIQSIIPIIITNLINGNTLNLDGGSGSISGVLLKFYRTLPSETVSKLTELQAVGMIGPLTKGDRRGLHDSLRHFAKERSQHR